MRTFLLTLLIAFFISGCTLLYPTKPNPEPSYAKDGVYVATIEKFIILKPKLYTYYFTTKNGKFKATSYKYYFKSNDIVSLSVKNSTITSMFLINRQAQPKPQPTPKKEKITKKKITPSKITIPKPQSIAF